MPTFQAIPDDEQRMATYILQSVPAMLKAELNEFISYRTATFAAKRQGGAVQSISAEADKTALLRFLGYLDKTNRMPDGAALSIVFMIREDLGDVVEAYATWLQHTQKCMFSTVRYNSNPSHLHVPYQPLVVTDCHTDPSPDPHPHVPFRLQTTSMASYRSPPTATGTSTQATLCLPWTLHRWHRS